MRANGQSYNDGEVRIYSVNDARKPGDAPKRCLALKYTLRYEERTVGVVRHYEALRAGERVDMVLRCQRVPVSPLDVAVLSDGTQYVIRMVQHPRDVEPPSMDLTLRRAEQTYELA